MSHYVREPITFKPAKCSGQDTKNIRKKVSASLDVALQVEDDCNHAIRLTNDLKLGMIRCTMTKEQMIQQCNKIMEVLQK